MTLRVGDRAPDVAATGQDGKPISLHAFRGRYLVLYFYPKAFTFGCTIESKGFRDHAAEIEALGAAIVGVSMDSQATQCEFAASHQLPFALLADEQGELCRTYGVARALLKRPKRVTYVIDPEGRVAACFQHELNFTRHVDEVIAFLKARAVVPGTPAA